MFTLRLSVAALALTALSIPARADNKKDLLKEAGRRIDIAHGYRDPGDDQSIKRLRETTSKCLSAIDEGDVGLGLKSLTVRRYLWSGSKLRSVSERKGCCY